MARWTLLAIGIAIVACSDKDGDRLSRGASETTAEADSALRADSGGIETGSPSVTNRDTLSSADTGSGAAKPSSTSRGAGPGGPTGAEAMGGVAAATAPLDLPGDRIRQLQTALNDNGCDAGPVDGVVGSRTRRAIDCGLEKHKLGRDDYAGLYRSLNLSF